MTLSAGWAVSVPVLAAAALMARSPMDDTSPLRIRLTRLGREGGELVVCLDKGDRITDPFESALIRGPGEFKLAARDSGVAALDSTGRVLVAGPCLRARPESPEGYIRILLGEKSHRYSGSLDFTPAQPRSRAICITNEVPLEEYLGGVMANEMSPEAPREALLAQAIVSRSYAMRRRGGARDQGYDFDDTELSQVYGGLDSRTEATDGAVRGTEGMILKKDGVTVLSDYYADCGGVTAPGRDSSDYPPRVVDSPDGGRTDYCSGGRYHTWSYRLEARAARPHGFKEIRILEVDSSGRALFVELCGDGPPRRMPAPAFRAMMGYSTIKSTWFTVARESDGALVFQGRGYGHGHGFCQSGAIGMASAPHLMTCAQILEHYFPGSRIEAVGSRALPSPLKGEAEGGGTERVAR